MTKNTCQVSNCSNTAKCRGYCNPHYQRLHVYGDPLAGRPIDAQPSEHCSVEGCVKQPRSTFAIYCEMHYARMRRYGNVGEVSARKLTAVPEQCVFEGCVAKPAARGYCAKHYTRVQRHGDPNVKKSPGFVAGDPRHHNRKEMPNYFAAHERVRRLRGKAAQHACANCGDQAKQWAFVHDAAEVIAESAQGQYSPNPHDYEPLCVPCHKRADLARIQASIK